MDINQIDVKENAIKAIDPKILAILLKDKTTRKNIIWATDDYLSYGDGYAFGKGDSGETWVDVELTDEEAERLIKYGTQSEIYYDGFDECEELRDLYDKIYEIAIEQITDELRGADWIDAEDLDNPDWRADDLYSCGLNFPEEFEEMLVDEE